MDASRRIVMLDGGYPSYRLLRKALSERGCDLEVVPEEAASTREEQLAAARDAAGVFVRWTKVDGAFLDGLPRCRALVRFGTGYDNVDVDAATRREIGVANVSDYAGGSVSDHALALTLACLRAVGFDSAEDPEGFLTPPVSSIPELSELTVGVVGLGTIGGSYAEKIAPLAKEVLAHDPYVDASAFRSAGARRCRLNEMLEAADVLSLHCNLTGETRDLIDEAAFNQLGPGGYLVNTSRGEVVDETALREALGDGRIAAAGLDVFREEPPSEAYADLLGRPDVVATGHYGWYSDPAYERLHRTAATNMADLLAGDPPPDCLNPEIYG